MRKFNYDIDSWLLNAEINEINKNNNNIIFNINTIYLNAFTNNKITIYPHFDFRKDNYIYNSLNCIYINYKFHK